MRHDVATHSGRYGDYNAANPYAYQHNLTLQRQLAKNIAISIAYVDTQGEHIWQEVANNPIQPTAVVNGMQYWNINNASCQAGTFDPKSCERRFPQTDDARAWTRGLGFLPGQGYAAPAAR